MRSASVDSCLASFELPPFRELGLSFDPEPESFDRFMISSGVFNVLFRHSALAYMDPSIASKCMQSIELLDRRPSASTLRLWILDCRPSFDSRARHVIRARLFP